MSQATDHENLDALIQTWERQQDAYVHHRAQRFAIILDSIAYALPEAGVVLDLAGGLGSFSRLILDRFPGCRVVTLDYDPALLLLARENLSAYEARSTIIEADLRGSAWPASLDGVAPDVVVTSTALHWLSSAELVTLYGQLATVLPEGGLFFNADHLPLSPPGSFFRTVSTADDVRHQTDGFSEDVPDWAGWWDAVRACDGLTELVAERDRRFDGGSDNVDVNAPFHTAALQAAGFTEAGTIWQYFDDYVVYGRR